MRLYCWPPRLHAAMQVQDKVYEVMSTMPPHAARLPPTTRSAIQDYLKRWAGFLLVVPQANQGSRIWQWPISRTVRLRKTIWRRRWPFSWTLSSSGH